MEVENQRPLGGWRRLCRRARATLCHPSRRASAHPFSASDRPPARRTARPAAEPSGHDLDTISVTWARAAARPQAELAATGHMPDVLKQSCGRDLANAMQCAALHDHLPALLTAAFGELPAARSRRTLRSQRVLCGGRDHR